MKPIDPQFLISFEKMELAMLNQALLALALLGYALVRIGGPIDPVRAVMYVLFVAVGVAFFYSLMLMLASTSVWFGRNSGLYDFWFYVIIFRPLSARDLQRFAGRRRAAVHAFRS